MRIVTPILTATLALALAAPALGAPARNHSFGAAGKFAWTASGSGLVFFSDGTIPVEECTPGLRDCDDTLIELKSPGTLKASVTGGAGTQADVAIDIFESDASGTPGRQIQKGDASTPQVVESASADLDPGFYLVRVDFLLGTGEVEAEAEFTPGEATAPAPPAGGAGTPTPAANAAPKATPKVSKKIKASKLKGFGGTATDDGAVAKVEVGLLQVKGKKCKQLTSTSAKFAKSKSCSAPTKFLKAKGTSSWSLKLRKKLPKGRYVVFAKATDDKGVAQDPPAKASFTVS